MRRDGRVSTSHPLTVTQTNHNSVDSKQVQMFEYLVGWKKFFAPPCLIETFFYVAHTFLGDHGLDLHFEVSHPLLCDSAYIMKCAAF